MTARDISIAVVIPCYNDAAYLPRAMHSVLPQLSAIDELVVVDDGSTDDIDDIVCGFIRCYPQRRIKFHRQANAGVSAARNVGASLAEAQFLVFLDADDELTVRALAGFRAVVGEHASPRADVVCGGHEWLRHGAAKIRKPELDSNRETNFRNFLHKKIHLGNLASFCIARSTYERIKFAESLRVGEDYVLILLLLANYSVRCCPLVVARVHRREQHSLRSAAGLADLAASRVNAELFAHPCLPSAYQKYRAAAERRHLMSLLRSYWRTRRATDFVDTFAHLAQMDRRIWWSKWAYRYLAIRVATRMSAELG